MTFKDQHNSKVENHFVMVNKTFIMRAYLSQKCHVESHYATIGQPCLMHDTISPIGSCLAFKIGDIMYRMLHFEIMSTAYHKTGCKVLRLDHVLNVCMLHTLKNLK